MNRRIVLARRPVGAPTPDCFRLEEVPEATPAEGEVKLQTLYFSLDPYMRSRMSDAASYAQPVAIDGVMTAGAVSRVVESRAPNLQAGDLVLGETGWQERPVASGKALMKLDMAGAPASWALGVLGMPGLTAYSGRLEIDHPKPGEIVVVSAPTGPVGSVVGQIAKLKGSRVFGIAGGADKCEYAVRELGFDACLDHGGDDLPQRLAAACPKGIDVYFENVGGKVLLAVLPLLNVGARLPLCGVIAWYNLTGLPQGPDFTPMLMRALLMKRAKLQGFIISDHYDQRPRFVKDMAGWLAAGQVKVREDVVDGLDRAPEAFIGLLQGRNFGKLVVRIGGA